MLQLNRRREDILSMLPKASIGAEIGVFDGKFSKRIGRALLPRLLYLIDPWWTLPTPTRPLSAMTDAYDRMRDSMSWWIEKDLVKVLIQKSHVALAEMNDEHLDWAYLDSSHEETETLDELRLLRSKVKATGIICGHDFGSRRHTGVFRALSRFLREAPEKELFVLDNFGQWAVRNRGQPEVRAYESR